MQKMTNVAGIYPLTTPQQDILHHLLREPESKVTFEQIRRSLEGPLDVLHLLLAWDVVVERHPALRTNLLWEGLESPLQVVRQKVAIPWDIHDWRDNLVDVEVRLDHLAAGYRSTSFDLAQAPLFKMALIRLGDRRHHLIWNFTQLLLDDHSSHQIIDEAMTTYDEFVRDQQPQQARNGRLSITAPVSRTGISELL